MAGRGDRYYTYTELLAIARRFRQNPNELMISWILRVYDQGGQALSLNSGELALLGDLTGDAVFNYHCKTLRGDCKTLLAWLLESATPVLPSAEASQVGLVLPARSASPLGAFMERLLCTSCAHRGPV